MELLDTVAAGMASGSSSEAAARELLNSKSAKQLPGWSVETMARYANVGKKLAQSPQTLAGLELMEYKFGRSSAFDGITALRALTSLGLSDQDSEFLDLTLTLVQCILRTFKHNAGIPMFVDDSLLTIIQSEFAISHITLDV